MPYEVAKRGPGLPSGALSEHLAGGLDDLVVGNVMEVLGEPPAVAEGIDHLAEAFAPERVCDRVKDRGAVSERPPPDRVGVVGVDD
jgi:hypothetical protein